MAFFFYFNAKTLIQSSASCNLLFIPSILLVIPDIALFISDWSFFMVSMPFFMLLSILIVITLNYLINCMPPFYVVLPLENALVLSFGSVSLSSHFHCFCGFSDLIVKLTSCLN